eukprot:4507320-Amphidinium_carterae.1
MFETSGGTATNLARSSPGSSLIFFMWRHWHVSFAPAGFDLAKSSRPQGRPQGELHSPALWTKANLNTFAT